MFEVLADRALDGVDARHPPASPKTNTSLFSMASRRTYSVCHIKGIRKTLLLGMPSVLQAASLLL